MLLLSLIHGDLYCTYDLKIEVTSKKAQYGEYKFAIKRYNTVQLCSSLQFGFKNRLDYDDYYAFFSFKRSLNIQ